jgi:hypothetical protein
MNAVSLNSPQVKRKAIIHDSSDDEVDTKSQSKYLKTHENFEKSLHEELLLIFKSKKNKEKMLPIIEQTFKYRRNIIENNNTVFLDLLDKFKYLTDVKNVSYENRFLFKVIYKLNFLSLKWSLAY